MKKAIPYLTVRSGVYYYVRRVPTDLKTSPLAEHLFGKSLTYRVSLKTRNWLDACSKAQVAESDFNSKCSELRSSLCSTTSASGSYPAEIDFKSIELLYNQRITDEYERLCSLAEIGGKQKEYYDHRKAVLEENAARLKVILTQPRAESKAGDLIDPLASAKSLITEFDMDVASISDHAQVVRAIKKGAYSGYLNAFKMMQGDGHASKDETDYVSLLKGKEPSIASISLETAVARHLAHREFPHRTVVEAKKALADFVEVHGNLELDLITAKHNRDFIKRIGERIVGNKHKGALERRVSPATVTKSVRLLSAAVGHSITIGDWDGRNPFSTAPIKALVPPTDKSVMIDKRGFETGEINKLMLHPWFTGCASDRKRSVAGSHRLNDAYFWSSLVALFSGCRANEIGGLRIDEIKYFEDEPFPHFVIKPNVHRGIKKHKIRKIPIHNELVNLGFLSYVDSIRLSGSERLFPKWLPKGYKGDGKDIWSNSNLIQSFNDEIIPQCLEIVKSEYRSPVSFHSFRGAYKKMMQLSCNDIPLNVVNEVIGHEKSPMDKHYIRTVPLEETYPLVSRAKYPGLILPPSPVPEFI